MITQNPIPLYFQLKNIIKQKIESKEWSEGTPIPGERELQRLYNLSRTPIRQAIGDLVNEGMLERRHGKGTFVAKKKIKQISTKMVGLVEGLYQKGLNPKIELLEYRVVEAPSHAIKVLKLKGIEKMLYVCRRISVDDDILFVDENYFNLALASFITKERFLTNTVFELIEMSGFNVTKGANTFSASHLSASLAKLLGLPSGSASLIVTTTTHGLNDVPFQYSISYCNPNKYEYEIMLDR